MPLLVVTKVLLYFICVLNVSEMKDHWIIYRLMHEVFSYWLRKLNVGSLIKDLFNKISFCFILYSWVLIGCLINSLHALPCTFRHASRFSLMPSEKGKWGHEQVQSVQYGLKLKMSKLNMIRKMDDSGIIVHSVFP